MRIIAFVGSPVEDNEKDVSSASPSRICCVCSPCTPKPDERFVPCPAEKKAVPQQGQCGLELLAEGLQLGSWFWGFAS